MASETLNETSDEAKTLQDIFRSFAGKSEIMESRTWLKLLKDTHVVNKNFTPTDCDLIFTKIKSKGAKGIDFSQFEQGLQLVATKKKLDYASILEMIQTTEGPKFTGTRAAPNRFHDDKNLYTGIHAHGGPSTIDTKSSSLFSEYAPNSRGSSVSAVKLEDLLDRSKPNVRGVNEKLG